MKNFKTYQLALELYEEVIKLNLKGEIRDQMERAALSIVSNLAEGSGRSQRNDRKRFSSLPWEACEKHKHYWR